MGKKRKILYRINKFLKSWPWKFLKSWPWPAMFLAGSVVGFALGRFPWEADSVNDWFKMIAQTVVGFGFAYWLLIKRNMLADGRENRLMSELAGSIRLHMAGVLAGLEPALNTFLDIAGNIDVNTVWVEDTGATLALEDIRKKINNVPAETIEEALKKSRETRDVELISDLSSLIIDLNTLKAEGDSEWTYSMRTSQNLYNKMSRFKGILLEVIEW